MSVLCAVDLDRTLIYSRSALGECSGDDLVAVERHRDENASWMTGVAAGLLARLAAGAVVVPVTTRTVAEWRRVTLPMPAGRYAVAANGGVLLVDGSPDPDWAREVRRRLRSVATLDEIWAEASGLCRPEWTAALRNADDLFCYAVLRTDRIPPGLVAEAAGVAAERGWRVSMSGRKLYWLPASVSKSAALAEVTSRTNASVVLAAGDSVLDRELLEAADAGIAARHGELVGSGWTAPRVAVTERTGVRAGEEIVGWLTAEAGRRR